MAIQKSAPQASLHVGVNSAYLQLVGGKQVFEGFMKAYLKEYAFKTINSRQFKSFVMSYFRDIAGIESIDWDTWYYGRGQREP